MIRVEPTSGKTPPFVLLDDRRGDRPGAALYRDPVRIIQCEDAGEVAGALAALDEAVETCHVAGFCAYELGYALEPRLAPLMPPVRRGPLLWFGVFAAREHLDDRAATAFLTRTMCSGHAMHGPRAGVTREAYDTAQAAIHAYLRAGDTYQINFTFPLSFTLDGDPVSLFAALRARQKVSHGALVWTGAEHILSLSPELFFERDHSTIRTRPMKGTVGRGRDPEEDARLAEALQADPKSRAENLMIVDLLRNDVGRLAQIGTVRVPDLFTRETYPTLHTLTSTVEARLDGDPAPSRILGALFPCGSITGAPKIRAMEIIRDLEAAPRGVYTGAVGAFGPDRGAHFNVAIRTLTVGRDGAATYGVGGGIVADSRDDAEYDECFLKARVVTGECEPFGLIETMLWCRGEGVALLGRHADRLAHSAQWWGFPCGNGDAFHGALAPHMGTLEAGTGEWARMRAVLWPSGDYQISVTPLGADPRGTVHRLVLSPERIDAADPYYRHKTTRRTLYDREHARLCGGGQADEVLFLNQWGDVAEGSRTSVFVERGGLLLTPPVSSGALPGVMRAALLADPSARVREARLTWADLCTAPRLFVANAVRGLCPAHLMEMPVAEDFANYPASRASRRPE